MTNQRRAFRYGFGAALTLAATVLWCTTITFSCGDFEASPGCTNQGGVEIATRVILAAIGFALAGFLVAMTVRSARRSR